MIEIVPKDSRYIPIVQQKSCCSVACILMIMQRQGIPLIAQELLGYHLGLVVAPENRKLFWKPRIGKRPLGGYGTQIYRKEFHPNTVFPKLGIPLEMIFHPISKFSDKEFSDFIFALVKENKDILICFDHGQFYGDNLRGGHVCVVDRINLSKGTIRLIDPQQSQPKWVIIKIEKLLKALRLHGDEKSGGLWEFKMRKK